MTTSSNNAPDDQELYKRVREFDEALAKGADSLSAKSSHPDLTGQAAEELSGLQECVELLEGVRRDRSSRISLTSSIQGLVAALGPEDVPKNIGRFELRGEVGRGGCGVVLRAYDTKLARDVAIKIPRPEALVSDDLRERFLREARAAGAVDHPNIVSIYEVGEEGPISYIAAAYIPGPSLAMWLGRKKGPLDIQQAARLVRALAGALEHAHQRGVVHRDIKPGNILLQPLTEHSESDCLDYFVPKIADFGLAKLRESAEVATHTGAMIGTPAYMAPEQAAGRLAEIGPATDVYALGAILFELLTGQPPLRGESDIDTLRRIVSDQPPLVRIARPRIPRDLEAICLKCLEKRPPQRYASAAALEHDLENFLEGKATQARPIGTTRRVWRWARYRPTVASLLMVSLMLFTVLVAGTWVYNARLARALLIAETEQRRAESETLVSRKLLYSAEVRLAYDAWRSLNRKRTIDLLERQIPEPGQADLREFAWHWLWGQSHAEVKTLEGHTADVFAVAFSPDGQRLATASKDGTARIWDVTSGEVLHSLERHSTEVTCLAFSPDGTLLATGSEDQHIILWNPQTGEDLFALTGHEGHVLTVVFSEDCRQLASGGRDKQVRLWDLDSREEIQALKPSLDVVRCIRYSPDGQTLAACDEAGEIHLWDTGNWEPLPPLSCTESPLFAIEFAGDSRRLVATGRDSTLFMWDLDSQECTSIPESNSHESWIRDTKLSPDGSLLANANQNGFAVLWSMGGGENGEPVREATIQGHAGRIWSVAWSPDGKLLATAGADKVVKLWHAEEELGASGFGASHGIIWDIEFATDATLLTSHQGGFLRAWDLNSHQCLETFRGPDFRDRTSLSLDPKQNIAATSAWGYNDVLFINYSSGEILNQIGAFSVGVNDIAVNNNGSMLAVAPEDSTVVTLDMPSGTQRDVLLHSSAVDCLAFSPDDESILTCSRELRLWDGHSGELRWGQRYYEADPRCAIFSPDGQMIAAAIGNRIVALIDPATGQVIGELQSDQGRGTTLAFTPDSRTLAVGTWKSNVITLWDTHTRQELCVLETDLGYLSDLAFSPDGTRLVAAGHPMGKQRTPDGTGQMVEWVLPSATPAR